MKIREMLQQDKVTLSFEVFPPKPGADFDKVYNAAMEVAALKPSYMSVTYGAGGSTRSNTVTIARDIQEKAGIEAIAHLTCVGAKRSDILETLAQIQAAGIENILAHRGDNPKNF